MTILLTKQQAAIRVGLHPEYLMTLAREGKFPRPVKYGSERNSAVRFVEAEIQEWIEARISERDSQAASKAAIITSKGAKVVALEGAA